MENAKLVIIFMVLFFTQSICAISISCRNCDVMTCECKTNCSTGLVSIYLEKCQGTPKYELSVIDGSITWKPTMEGTYYGKLLCDNGEKSDCETIIVPTKKIAEKISDENYFQYVVIIAFVLTLVFLIYKHFSKA